MRFLFFPHIQAKKAKISLEMHQKPKFSLKKLVFRLLKTFSDKKSEIGLMKTKIWDTVSQNRAFLGIFMGLKFEEKHKISRVT